MDADVLCSTAMIRRLALSHHESAFLLDASSPNTGEEQMLLVRDGWVRNIVRGGAPGYELMGESIGFLKLDADAARFLRELLDARIAAGDTESSTRRCIPRCSPRGEVATSGWTACRGPRSTFRRTSCARSARSCRDRGDVSDELQEAVVLATPEDLSSRVAGVPLLVRTILVLQRAGFERVHVPGAIDVPSDPRIRITIGRETRPTARTSSSGPAASSIRRSSRRRRARGTASCGNAAVRASSGVRRRRRRA
jgi:hypothetical protein